MTDVSILTLVLIIVAALLTGALHGATGMAGGIVMAAILSYLIGIKAAIPVMTCALIFSHASRVVLYWRDTDWSVAKRVLIFGAPMIVLGAIIFGLIDGRTVAIVFALFLIASFPIKAWAQKNQVKTDPKLLAGASMIWGVLAGNVIGPGFFLTPFLLGTGMNRMTFVGTMAIVTLAMNTIKLAVFGMTDLMTVDLLVLGVIIGVSTIPGNWMGRHVLRAMSDKHHRIAVDVLTILMIINFLYIAMIEA